MAASSPATTTTTRSLPISWRSCRRSTPSSEAPAGEPAGHDGASASLRTALRGLLLACHPGPVAAVTLAASAYAAAVGRGVEGVALVALAVLAGQLCIGWHNDYLDAEVDLRTERDKPIPNGLVGRRGVARASLLSGVATVPLSLASGWRAGSVHLLAVASALAYNARIKATALSFLPYAVSFGLLPLFVVLGLSPGRLPPWWTPAGTALLGVGAHFINVMKDRSADLVSGVRGLPQRLPERAGLLLGATALAASSLVLLLGSGSGTLRLAGAAVSCLLILLIVSAASLSRGHQAFRLVLVLGVFDVAVLVASGRILA